MVVNSAVDTAQRTNPIVLMLVVVVIGILAGVLVVTTGRLLGAVRQTRQATRGWQVQPFATTQRDPAEQTGPMDTGPDVDVLCSLVSDTIGHVVMSKSNDLAHVGDEPAPHIVIEATDGHVYMLTSDVSALRRSRRIVGRARVWRITNPRSFAFTRAQAMWERVRNTYTWQRANTKPLTIWHIVAMQPNAWRPDAGQSSMPQHAI